MDLAVICYLGHFAHLYSDDDIIIIVITVLLFW